MEFINYNVFNKALALVIPSRFFMYRMFTSSSVIASTAFGLLPFPSYYSCLLRDSEAIRVCSNSRSSILLFGYLQTFKWRLKLERNPLRLEGSNSPPSLLLTVIINSLNKSPSCSGIISYTFLSALFFFKNAMKMEMSLCVLVACSCFPAPE